MDDWDHFRRLGILMTLDGGVRVHLCLDRREATALFRRLTNPDWDPEEDRAEVQSRDTEAWWQRDKDEEGARTGPRYLVLYRDNYFAVHLPAGIGEELIAMLQERLPEFVK
jgi:hypothetical protein